MLKARAFKNPGMILFARYAFMPNRLGFCGPKENWILFNSVIKDKPEKGLKKALSKFPAALIYLRKIAEKARVSDPFNEKVVEAYFLGNQLLEKTPSKPHHNFHVFNFFPLTPKLKRTLENMDKCRISWGKVIKIKRNKLKVEYQPLVIKNGQLKLGSPRTKTILYKIKNESSIPKVKVGNFISFHWDWACQILNKREVRNLEKYTQYHLARVNEQSK